MSDLYGDALVQSTRQISTRGEFAAFTIKLSENLKYYPEEWENATLEDFIEGLAGFLSSMDGYYASIGDNVNCEKPSWRVFADALLAGRVYE